MMILKDVDPGGVVGLGSGVYFKGGVIDAIGIVSLYSVVNYIKINPSFLVYGVCHIGEYTINKPLTTNPCSLSDLEFGFVFRLDTPIGRSKRFIKIGKINNSNIIVCGVMSDLCAVVPEESDVEYFSTPKDTYGASDETWGGWGTCVNCNATSNIKKKEDLEKMTVEFDCALCGCKTTISL